MHIQQIHLKNFRNYSDQKVNFHDKVNIIIGNNAQGKTNLLEAVYMTSFAKSFRTNRDNDMILFDKENAKIEAAALKDNIELNLEIILSKNTKKMIKLNGVKLRKNVDILNHVFTVIFSPEDLRIVKDGPEKRRNFLNRELCQIKPIYYHNLYKYSKILLQRNAFLKNCKLQNDEKLLSIWNEEMVHYGLNIIKERNIFIKKLNKISSHIHSNVTDGKENLVLSYECNVKAYEQDMAENKKIYEKALKYVENKDYLRGNTSIGPHKDDIHISVNGQDVRNFGSQGQQRTASLSLKLAEIQLIFEETGEMPILLLDDVLSELDAGRQKFLIHFLKNMQVFITTTEISEFLKINLPENYIFQVYNGCVKRV